MKEQELIDVAEAARLTGLDKDTIYKLARQGRIRSFKVMGSALRFDRGEVLKLIQERTAASGARA